MKSILLAGVFALMTSLGVHAEDDAKAQGIFEKLIAATEANDFDAFTANCSTQMKAAFAKSQFSASAEILNPKFIKQPEILLLGELNQRGYEVYLYRLRFKDGTDDMLGTLTLKNGEVAGILFH